MSTAAHDPGLDLEQLRTLHARRRGVATSPKITHLLERIENHLAEHDGYLAFSGGKDSLVVLDLARQVDPAVPVAFFDSGLEYPEVTTYIHDLAQAWDLNLTVFPAEPTALEIITGSGIWDHDQPSTLGLDLGAALINDPSARAHAADGPGELWGVRAAESRGRRMLYANEITKEIARACHGCCPPGRRTRTHYLTHGGVVRRNDGTVAYSPIWDWPTQRVWDYIAARSLPPNPVYAKLRALGAPEEALRISTLLSDTGLQHGRITWLRRGWPSLFAELAHQLPRLREFV